jgi:hypothetical protein
MCQRFAVPDRASTRMTYPADVAHSAPSPYDISPASLGSSVTAIGRPSLEIFQTPLSLAAHT